MSSWASRDPAAGAPRRPARHGPRRGWVGWLEQHRPVVGGLALWVSVGIIAGAAAATGGATARGRGGGSGAATGAAGRPTSPGGPGSTAGIGSGRQGPEGSGSAPGQSGGPGSTSGSATGSPAPGGTPPPPGSTSPPPRGGSTGGCRAAPTGETGVTATQVKVGQIVTDSSNLPGQFRPTYEGLMAYVKLVNDAGGICGRKLSVEYQNDNSNPTTHDYQAMAQRNFAFVANESLLDNLDYQTSPPFDPRYRDDRTGGFVPDVGGLAFAYGRAQSDWHAGVVGSVSPVLIGGGQFDFFVDDARNRGEPCKKAGVLYLVEPTGASKDQGLLFKEALAQPWGAGMGESNVKTYQAALLSTVLTYRGIVMQMVVDGVNCVFTSADLASNINFVKALYEEGVWPPDSCKGNDCFSVVWIPFSAYDPEFIRDGGQGARFVSSFLPHVPLNESSNPALQGYVNALDALAASNPEFAGAEPTTFSLLGYASGMMFGEALAACGSAPTRTCVMSYLRGLRNFTAGGLLGRITPFRTTRATYGDYGTFDWKWIFTDSVAVRVEGNEPDLINRFHRINPPGGGFFPDTLHVARGTPA